VTIPASTLVDQLAHAKKGEEPVDGVMKAPEKVAEAPQTIDRAGDADVKPVNRMQSPHRALKAIRPIILLIALAALATLLWFATRSPPLTVQGEVSADRIDVSPRVAGRVLKLGANVGDTIQRGVLLIELESPQLVAALVGARAAVGVAKADLDRVNSTRPETIAARKAEFAAVEADVVLYQETYNRQVEEQLLLVEKLENDKGLKENVEQQIEKIAGKLDLLRKRDLNELSVEDFLQSSKYLTALEESLKALTQEKQRLDVSIMSRESRLEELNKGLVLLRVELELLRSNISRINQLKQEVRNEYINKMDKRKMKAA